MTRIFFFNDTATTEIYTLSLHDALPIWVLGGVEDYVRHGLRLVDRRDAHRLDAQLGAPLVEERRVYGPGHHLRDADGPSLVLELHSQGLQEAVDAVLGGPVGAMEREGALGFDRGDVDQGPAALSL